jgi:hypothetical protein
MNQTRSVAASMERLRIETGADVVSHAAFSSAKVCGPRRAWWRSVLSRLDELCKLPTGWDGYNALPVFFGNAYFALNMLASACPPDAPEPQIVPGSNGDLQIEWHTETTDIELHVRIPNDVDAWRAVTSAPDHEDHLHLTMDFKVVAGWLAELSETPVAARTSAA